MDTATKVLRAKTHDAHVALERSQLAHDLMSPELTCNRYVEILVAWAAAWTNLENCIWSSPVAHLVPGLLPRRCAHLAHEDLQYWRQQGYDVADNPSQATSPWSGLLPTHAAGLLGICYVAQGATLGSKVIAAKLQKTLHFGTGCGMSFFAPHAPIDASAVPWPDWSARLNAQLDSPENLALAVVWANATFAALHASFLIADQARVSAV